MLTPCRGKIVFLFALWLVNGGIGGSPLLFAENENQAGNKPTYFKLQGDNLAQAVELTESQEKGEKAPLPGHQVGTFKPDIVLSNTIQLALKDVIRETLKNNVTIAVQNYTNKIREQNIITSESEFDPIFSVDLKATDDTNPVASAFANPQIQETESQSWTLGLSQKLHPGTEYQFSFLGQRDGNNSQFAGLNPQYTTRIELNVTQPLLKNFGSDINKTNIYIANNNLEISRYDFIEEVIDTLTTAENVYWDLVFSREDMKVKQQSVQRALDFERRVRAQVEVGTLAPLEILQAQSEVASREEAVINSHKLIRDNEDNLKNVLNIAFDSEYGPKEIAPLDAPEFDPQFKIELDEAIREALQKRPDYLAKRKELDSKNIEVRFNKNQLYPTLDLVASYGLNGLSGDARSVTLGGAPQTTPFGGTYSRGVERALSTDFDSWEAGIQFRYPLGNRDAESRLSASKLEAAQLLLDIKDLEKSIILEVREAARTLDTAIKRVQAARVSRKLAEEKLVAEEKKFEVGLSTSFNVLEFQTDLAEEQSKELKAIIDFNKSKINLRKAIASTLEYHSIELASETTE